MEELKVKNLVLAVFLASLAACSSFPGKEVVQVQTPVVQDFPEPPQVEKPNLDIESLTQEDFDSKNYAKISKAMSVTIQQLLDYSTKLETYLNVYRRGETK
jgi:hypothetical protein